MFKPTNKLRERIHSSWRGGRLHHWRHLNRARLRALFIWPRMIALRARCRLGGKRLVAIALLEHCGDIVACEPIARHLRNSMSHAYLVWCVRAPYRELLDHNPNLDRVLILGCLTEWILLRRTGAFDRIVDLHARKRSCPVCWVPLEKTEGQSELDINNYYRFGSLQKVAMLSSDLGELSTAAPKVYYGENIGHRVDKFGLPSRFVVFHAKSNESERDWTSEKWGKLQKLICDELQICIVEIGLFPVLSASSDMYRSLCGQTSWLELAEVIRRSSAFVGIDSGPAHFANAVGTPGVVLLGKYRSFSRYMPFTGRYAEGVGCELVYADGPASTISVRSVYDALLRILAGTPCSE